LLEKRRGSVTLAGMLSRPSFSIMRVFRISFSLLIAGMVSAQPLFAQAPPAAPATTWAPREIGEVQFESPFELKDFGDVAASLPPDVKEKIESMRSSMGGSEGSFVVFVTSSTYKAGLALNLDGAVKGMINGAASKMGDANPQFTSNNVKVSGLEARKGSYQKSLPDGRTVRIEFLAIGRGQTLWQVQALTMNEKAAPDMARLLASVAIKAAP
jgi:hypothetical protein